MSLHATLTVLSERTRHLAFQDDDSPLSFRALLDRLETQPQTRHWFSAQLAASPWPAFRWECPAVSSVNADRPYECVVVAAPELRDRADARPFAEAFARHAGELAFAMPNLGGDADLIVPTPQDSARDAAVYPHLAAFLRGASEAQQQAFWKLTAQTVKTHLSDRPLWLNTAGAGVAWLHLRLDQRPKYYAHSPYRETT
jgi:hypothetical protein